MAEENDNNNWEGRSQDDPSGIQEGIEEMGYALSRDIPSDEGAIKLLAGLMSHFDMDLSRTQLDPELPLEVQLDSSLHEDQKLSEIAEEFDIELELDEELDLVKAYSRNLDQANVQNFSKAVDREFEAKLHLTDLTPQDMVNVPDFKVSADLINELDEKIKIEFGKEVSVSSIIESREGLQGVFQETDSLLNTLNEAKGKGWDLSAESMKDVSHYFNENLSLDEKMSLTEENAPKFVLMTSLGEIGEKLRVGEGQSFSLNDSADKEALKFIDTIASSVNEDIGINYVEMDEAISFDMDYEMLEEHELGSLAKSYDISSQAVKNDEGIEVIRITSETNNQSNISNFKGNLESAYGDDVISNIRTPRDLGLSDEFVISTEKIHSFDSKVKAEYGEQVGLTNIAENKESLQNVFKDHAEISESLRKGQFIGHDMNHSTMKEVSAHLSDNLTIEDKMAITKDNMPKMTLKSSLNKVTEKVKVKHETKNSISISS